MTWFFWKKPIEEPIEEKKVVAERVKNEIIKLINESRAMSPQDRFGIFLPLQTLLYSNADGISIDIYLRKIIKYLNNNNYIELPNIIRYLDKLNNLKYNNLNYKNLNYKNIWNEAANDWNSMNTAKILKSGGRQRHINRRKIITRRLKKHKKKSKKNTKRHKKSKKSTKKRKKTKKYKKRR